MNIINCDLCGKRYKVDLSKLAKETKFKCKACNNTIDVDKTGQEALLPTGIVDVESETSKPSISVGPKERSNPVSMNEVSSNQPIPPISVPMGTTKVQWWRSIQSSISLTLIVITITVFALFTLFNVYKSKNKMARDLNSYADVTATRLSNYLVEAFWSLDDKLMNDSIVSEMEASHIYSIVLRYRDRNDVYLSKIRNDLTWKIEDNKYDIEGDFLKSVKPIIRDDKKIGVVEVYVTSRFMLEEFRSQMTQNMITALTLVLVIFISSFLMLRRVIINPINKLTYAADKVSMGQTNAVIEVSSKNEIGSLARSFDRMRSSLNLALKNM